MHCTFRSFSRRSVIGISEFGAKPMVHQRRNGPTPSVHLPPIFPGSVDCSDSVPPPDLHMKLFRLFGDAAFIFVPDAGSNSAAGTDRYRFDLEPGIGSGLKFHFGRSERGFVIQFGRGVQCEAAAQNQNRLNELTVIPQDIKKPLGIALGGGLAEFRHQKRVK